MSRPSANSAAPSSSPPTDHTAVAAPAAPAALPLRSEFYPSTRSLYVTQWVVPGAAASSVVGGVVGAALAAVLHPRRPLFSSSLTVASKFGGCALVYLGAVSSWTKRAPPEWNHNRLVVHTGVGAFTGALLGSITGRSWGATGNRARGMGRGALLGAALAIPAWWVIEGRHSGLDDLDGEGAGRASAVKS